MTFPREGVFEGSCGCGPVGSDGQPADVRCNPRKGPCPPEGWQRWKGARFVPRRALKAEGIWDRFAGRFLKDPEMGCGRAPMSSAALTSQLEEGTFIPYSKRFDLFRSKEGLWTVYDNKTASMLQAVAPWKTRAGAVSWLKKNAKKADKFFCRSPHAPHAPRPPRPPKPAKAKKGKKPGRFVEAVPGVGSAPLTSSEEMQAKWAEEEAEREAQLDRAHAESSPEPTMPESMGMTRFTGDEETRENPGHSKGLAGLKRKLHAHDTAIHALQRGVKKIGETQRKQGSALVSVLRAMGGQKNHLRKLTSGR